MRRIHLAYCLIAILSCASCHSNYSAWLDETKPDRPRNLSPEVKIAINNLNINDVPKIARMEPGLIDRLDTQLKSIGAHLAADGKVYDRSGKEVYFVPPDPGSGTWPGPMPEELQERKLKEWEDLNNKYTVIILPLVGPSPP